MILTITPNAAVDKTYQVPEFRLDCVNRPVESFTVAGGKGINVARVYQTLGGQAVATGFIGGRNGAIVADAMAQEGIRSEFVSVEGESRTCIAIIDPESHTQTQINESGPSVSPENARDLLAKVRILLSEHSFEFVVMCGSLPPEAPASLYADLIELSKSFGARTVLDASGDPLRLGLEARPWMVKPNQPELEGLFGKPLRDQASLIDCALYLRSQGVDVVAVTMGAKGALVSAGTDMWLASPAPIKFASAVASGDSFVASFLWSWGHTKDSLPDAIEPEANRIREALRLGVGAGAANAAVIGAGFCTKASILAEADKVQKQRLFHSADARRNI